MLFSDLKANDPEVVPLAVARLWDEVRARDLATHGKLWSCCELGCDEADFAWLLAFASDFSAYQAQRWMDARSEFSIEIGYRSVSSFQAIGMLLLLLFSECARREGREGEIWAAVRCDKSGAPRFPWAHGKLWHPSGAPRGRIYRALREATYFWGVRHCFRGGDEQEYIGTIRLQFGFTLDGIKRLPEWLCGYGWPAPVRELVRDRQHQSAGFRRLWSSLHALRDGTLTRAAWEIKAGDSPWLLPTWIDAVGEAALSRPALRAIENTRVEAENEVARAALEAIWDGNGGPGLATGADFLDEPKLYFAGDAPYFGCGARAFLAPKGAPWLSKEAVSLSLYIGARLVGQWHSTASGGRNFAPTQDHYELPAIEPSLKARLVCGETVVAQQELELWDGRDGLGLWKRATGARLDVWNHAPRSDGDYVMLVDADLEIQPLPATWKKLGERTLLMPEAGWWSSAQITEDGAPFWTPATSEEPAWAQGFAVTFETHSPSDGAIESAPEAPPTLRLGEAFGLRVTLPPGVAIDALRWGGRTLESPEPGLFCAPPLTPQNLVAVLPLEAELRRQDKIETEMATVRRRLKLPLRAVMWRGSKREEWQIASKGDTWNSALPREWRLWGTWSGGARLCEGGVPFAMVPARARSIRPPQGWGAPISIREAPYGSGDTLLTLCGAARDGGVVRDVRRTAVGQIDLELTTDIEPSAGHQVLVWGQGGAFSACPGGHIQAAKSGAGTRWMTPFCFQNERAPVFAVGLAYEGVWLGGWFAPKWADLQPKAWDSERAARFALWTRWMALPWAENPQVLCEIARRWPAEVLLAWLGDAAGNKWGLRPRLPANDLVRDVFRGEFAGDAGAAATLVKGWGSPMELLQTLSEADPFLTVSFGRKWAKTYQPKAFAGLLRVAAKRVDVPREAGELLSPDQGRVPQLALQRHRGAVLSDEERRALRVGLDNPTARRRAAALLLQTFATELTA